MAIMASSTSLHFYTSKPNPSFPSSLKKPQLQQGRSILLKAADPEAETQESETETPVAASTSQQQQSDNADSFEKRLSQVRLKYKSGTGKKAEVRKSKKSSAGSNSKAKGSSSGGGVFLPPVPLKEAVSGGVKVDFGFSPYTERLHGRLAGLGLAALLLVELGSGKSVLRYHGPAIVFLQVYFVAAVSAVIVKYEKERISIWPQK